MTKVLSANMATETGTEQELLGEFLRHYVCPVIDNFPVNINVKKVGDATWWSFEAEVTIEPLVSKH
jgi:hypothetical protein